MSSPYRTSGKVPRRWPPAKKRPWWRTLYLRWLILFALRLRRAYCPDCGHFMTLRTSGIEWMQWEEKVPSDPSRRPKPCSVHRWFRPSYEGRGVHFSKMKRM